MEGDDGRLVRMEGGNILFMNDTEFQSRRLRGSYGRLNGAGAVQACTGGCVQTGFQLTSIILYERHYEYITHTHIHKLSLWGISTDVYK